MKIEVVDEWDMEIENVGEGGESHSPYVTLEFSDEGGALGTFDVPASALPTGATVGTRLRLAEEV